jgi:lauroyl/myristoyl acyltransferase
MWALYAFSSFLYLLAFYVVRHRHQVIREQLEKVFPDSSDADREPSTSNSSRISATSWSKCGNP